MHAKKTAIGAVAIASSFMFSSAAQADLLNLHLFPRSSTGEAVIETPAVIQHAPINSCSTTVIPAVVTRPVLGPPLVTHDMIRAVPSTINDWQSPLRLETLPAVIEPQFEIIAPVVDSGADYAAPTAVIDTMPVHTLPAGISLIDSQREFPAVIDTTLAEPAVMPSLPAITAPSPVLSTLPMVTDPTVMPAFPALGEIDNRPTFAAVIEPSVMQAAPVCTICEPLVQPAIIQAAPLCKRGR